MTRSNSRAAVCVAVQANDNSERPNLDWTASKVVFSSYASNLASTDRNGTPDLFAAQDVFVRNLAAGTTVQVSTSSRGVGGNDVSYDPDVSGNGRYVAFASRATDLVPGDTNGQIDVFVKDLQTGTTERVRVGAVGQGNGASSSASISGDGRYVVFTSIARNLVMGDTNGSYDAFVRDRVAGTTRRRVSVSAQGGQADGNIGSAGLSNDGWVVAMTGQTTNLAHGDPGRWRLRRQLVPGGRRDQRGRPGGDLEQLGQRHRRRRHQRHLRRLRHPPRQLRADAHSPDRRDPRSRSIRVPAVLHAQDQDLVWVLQDSVEHAVRPPPDRPDAGELTAQGLATTRGRSSSEPVRNSTTAAATASGSSCARVRRAGGVTASWSGAGSVTQGAHGVDAAQDVACLVGLVGLPHVHQRPSISQDGQRFLELGEVLWTEEHSSGPAVAGHHDPLVLTFHPVHQLGQVVADGTQWLDGHATVVASARRTSSPGAWVGPSCASSRAAEGGAGAGPWPAAGVTPT